MKRSAEEIRRIESALMNESIVSIQPIHMPVVPSRQAALTSKTEMISEARWKIANAIVELSDGELLPEESDRHIALRIGSPPNSNTITVSKRENRVSFYILSQDLLEGAEQFAPKPLKSEAPRDKDRYRFSGLRLEDIQAHETLFRKIVKESVRVIKDRRAQKN